MMILSFAVVIYDRQNRERTFAKRRAINHTHYVPFYRLSNRTTDDTNIIRTKYWCENIRYGDLISAQGNNFAVKIPADQLGKIIVLPIFYSANVNLETKTAVITVKENNKEIICKALGYDSKQVEQQSDKLINSQKYKRLKDLAASSNTKLSYMIVTKIQLEL